MGKSKKSTFTLNDYPRICLKSFEEEPFNEIDSAIFSWLSYLLIHEDVANSYSAEGMPMIDLLKAEYFEEMFKGIYWQKESFDLLVHVVSNPRYRGAVIKYYRFENDLDITLQFSAMVIGFKEGFHYVVYRGTDKTVHGWKEDLMLIMSKAAPVQRMAVNYLNGIGAKTKGDLIVGGHSKGGNLAVYASAHCNKEIRDRILRVYSHDGPGFTSSDLEQEGMKALKGRITKNIPTGSLVGLMMRNETEPSFIKSTIHGPMQHYPGSWVIDGNHFLRKENRPDISDKVINNINVWAEAVSDDKLELFMETLFEIVESAGVNDLDEILSEPSKYIFYYVKTFAKTEQGKRKVIISNFMDAIRGKVRTSNNQSDDPDWESIEQMIADDEVKQFNQSFDLFI